MTAGFPNLFLITGPGSPSVLEHGGLHRTTCGVGGRRMTDLGHGGFDVIEPTERAEAGWMRHQADSAAITLFPKGNSWYVGANVPGKPQVFLPTPTVSTSTARPARR
jgi:hypothetical protein